MKAWLLVQTLEGFTNNILVTGDTVNPEDYALRTGPWRHVPIIAIEVSITAIKHKQQKYLDTLAQQEFKTVNTIDAEEALLS